jgi:amino-acid N-acetyltransferase
VRLRNARESDVAALSALINGYAARNLLLARSEASLRARLAEFSVAEAAGVVVGCAALSPLGVGLAEVRSLAVAEDHAGRGIGRALVERLVERAARAGYGELLAMTRRVSFFEALGFEVTRRERFLDKLEIDCRHCPLNLDCDEVAMLRPVVPRSAAAQAGQGAGEVAWE